MAARKPPRQGRPWTPEVVRQRLSASMIANRLTKHVLGKLDMTPSQVTAGLGLLKKCVPDLSAVEHSGDMTVRTPQELSDVELANIAATGSSRVTKTKGRTKEPTDLH